MGEKEVSEVSIENKLPKFSHKEECETSMDNTMKGDLTSTEEKICEVKEKEAENVTTSTEKKEDDEAEKIPKEDEVKRSGEAEIASNTEAKCELQNPVSQKEKAIPEDLEEKIKEVSTIIIGEKDVRNQTGATIEQNLEDKKGEVPKTLEMTTTEVKPTVKELLESRNDEKCSETKVNGTEEKEVETSTINELVSVNTTVGNKVSDLPREIQDSLSTEEKQDDLKLSEPTNEAIEKIEVGTSAEIKKESLINEKENAKSIDKENKEESYTAIEGKHLEETIDTSKKGTRETDTVNTIVDTESKETRENNAKVEVCSTIDISSIGKNKDFVESSTISEKTFEEEEVVVTIIESTQAAVTEGDKTTQAISTEVKESLKSEDISSAKFDKDSTEIKEGIQSSKTHLTNTEVSKETVQGVTEAMSSSIEKIDHDKPEETENITNIIIPSNDSKGDGLNQNEEVSEHIHKKTKEEKDDQENSNKASEQEKNGDEVDISSKVDSDLHAVIPEEKVSEAKEQEDPKMMIEQGNKTKGEVTPTESKKDYSLEADESTKEKESKKDCKDLGKTSEVEELKEQPSADFDRDPEDASSNKKDKEEPKARDTESQNNGNTVSSKKESEETASISPANDTKLEKDSKKEKAEVDSLSESIVADTYKASIEDSKLSEESIKVDKEKDS